MQAEKDFLTLAPSAFRSHKRSSSDTRSSNDLITFTELNQKELNKSSPNKNLNKKLEAYGPKAPEVLNKLKLNTNKNYEDILIDSTHSDNSEKSFEYDSNSFNDTPNSESESDSSNKDMSHIKEIKNLIKAFFSDFEGGTVDLLSGMLLVMTFHDYRENLTGNTIDFEDTAWFSGRYFMKFAAAAYGNMLACLKMRKKFFQYWSGDNADDGTESGKKKARIYSIPPKGDKRVIFEHTGISTDDFICGRWGAGVARGGSKFLPGYYLCVDHNSTNVILALRGSSNLNDALTDLVGAYQAYKNGAVHKGMFHMTQKLIDELSDVILETLAKFPGYGFVVCGHSLGAGITSLFTLVFHDLHPDIPIHGYAYACPCTMDCVLSDYCKDFLTTFVNGDDCVSRISLGSLEELKITMQNFLDSAGNSLGSTLFHVTKQLTGIQSSRLATIFRVSKLQAQKKIEDYKMQDRLSHLYPPGKVYHIYKNSENVIQGELSHYSKFGHIVISGTMFTDHMPHIYESALKQLSDPFLALSKRYHKRNLGYFGSKWLSRNKILIVSINPLVTRASSVQEIYEKCESIDIHHIIKNKLLLFNNEHPYLRYYNTSDLSVQFIQQLTMKKNCDILKPKLVSNSHNIQLDNYNSLAKDIIDIDSDNSEEFFDCESAEDNNELRNSFSAILKNSLGLSETSDEHENISNSLKNSIVCEDNEIPFLSLNLDSLVELQLSLFELERELKCKESALQKRELDIIERENKLKYIEDTFLNNDESEKTISVSKKKTKKKSPRKEKRSSLKIFSRSKK